MIEKHCIPLYSTDQIRRLEARAFKTTSPTELMERAGKCAYDVMVEIWPLLEKIVVVCGPGNNGGDGYVLAKYAEQAGIDVQIWKVAESKSAEAKAAAKSCIHLIKDQVDLDATDLIIDAYLGIGLEGDSLKAEAHKIIEMINAADKLVFSLDCPSGLNTDTGKALGTAVQANETLTFIALKQGLFTGEARDYCGGITCDDLDLESLIYKDEDPVCYLHSIDGLGEVLPPRKRTAHKGDNGHVLIIGGNYGYAGAVKMAAEGALRTGAGLVSVATRQAHIAGIIANRPEIMAHGIEKAEDLKLLLDKATVIVLGPGLGQDEWAKGLFNEAIASDKSTVVDADALILLSKSKVIKNENWVLTPHPGEAATLLSTTASDIQADRFKSVTALLATYEGTVILKGAGSLVLGARQKIKICPYGNPGMASGGMGDILSGIIGALVAQGFEQEEAAIWGVTLHACAADLASEEGERGMIASDILPYIRELVG